MSDIDIEQIEIKSIKVPRKQSIIINNFFSLITIVIISIVVIWYVNYIFPEQQKAKKRALVIEKQYQYLIEKRKERKAQIELSKKLHLKYKEKKNETK
jgi:hypothetical protein